jgi:NADH:ubiquinone oxidoreductase subunit 2 (subunit N)
VALLHNETATFDMAALGRFLWRHGEPLPFSLYVGLGAVLGGIALCTGLVSAFGTFDEGGHSPVSHLLALLVFLRLGLHLGALAWECFWICLFFSLVCLVYGWAMALSQTLHDPLRRIWGLLAAQRGLLLLALAFVFRGQDLTLLVTVIVAYALVQGVVRLGLRWLLASGDVALAGLLFRAVIEMPLLGVPLCFGFLSLIGLPPTLGFIVRAELVRLGWAGGLTWLAPCVVAMSIFSLWGLAPLVIPSSQQERAFIDSPPPWPLRITLVLAAAALVALGLFPLPLVRLASWVVGG